MTWQMVTSILWRQKQLCKEEMDQCKWGFLIYIGWLAKCSKLRKGQKDVRQ